MEKKSLTEAQSNVLDFIKAYMEKNHLPPTYDEIAENFGFRSKNSVETHLQALEKKGVIQRIGKKARGIRLNEPLTLDRSHLIPLVGTVAAGTPILAEENISEYLDLYKVFYSNAELFALNVKGDSMIKAGIMDGDKVVVQKQPFIDNGEIGVAVIEDEATVKRIFLKADGVILHPENDELEDMFVSKDQENFLIAGKVIGVIRRMD